MITCQKQEEKPIMKLNNKKLNTLIDGIIIPLIVFVLTTYFTSLVGTTISKSINPVLVQGIANTISLFILIPLYVNFIKNNNLSYDKVNILMIVYVMAIGVALCYICNIIINYIPRIKANVVTENVYKLTEELNVYVTLFIITIIVPLLEEIIFRGFFYDTVKIISNDLMAIILSSITFAFSHSDLQQITYAFVAGVFLAYIRYKCNNIIYTIIMHFIMNLTAYILIPNMIYEKKLDIFMIFIMLCILVISVVRINLFYNINNNI